MIIVDNIVVNVIVDVDIVDTVIKIVIIACDECK
jgi:hypothetical protein